MLQIYRNTEESSQEVLGCPMPRFFYHHHLIWVWHLWHGKETVLTSCHCLAYHLLCSPYFYRPLLCFYSRSYSLSSGLLCLLLAVRISPILMTFTVLNGTNQDFLSSHRFEFVWCFSHDNSDISLGSRGKSSEVKCPFQSHCNFKTIFSAWGWCVLPLALSFTQTVGITLPAIVLSLVPTLCSSVGSDRALLTLLER